MKIKYFGTSAAEGIPGLFCNCSICTQAKEKGGRNIRTRSQALINDKILIDLPPDTLYHVQHLGLELHKIKHLFITHAHSDHLLASDLLEKRIGHSVCQDVQRIDVYGSMPTVDKIFKEIRTVTDITDGFWTLHELMPYSAVSVDSHMITPYKANHRFQLYPLIFSINDGSKNMLYAHDTGYFLDETWQKFKENNEFFNFVSLDCTAGLLEGRRDNHMSYDVCLETKQRMLSEGFANDSTVFVLNHFSHIGNADYDKLCDVCEKEGFIISYDGMELEF